MNGLFSILILACVILSSGCSIKHPIAKDYGKYLNNNEGSSNFNTTDVEADYLLAPHTEEHRYEFRAATVGYAHLWIVEFWDIFKTTRESKDIQAAFSRLTKKDPREHGKSA